MGTATTPRLRPIATGTVPLPPGYVYRPEARNLLEALGRGVPARERIVCPIGAFLIEHPDAGPVLVDTGMHPLTATDPRRNLGRVGALVMRGVRIGARENVPDRLGDWGIDVSGVRLVVMTHLHADHTSAMPALPDARFVIDRREWAAARRRLAGLDGYIPAHLPSEASVDLVDVAAGKPFEGLRSTIDLLGDGTIRLVSTPGHTVGHLSVLVQTAEGPVLLLGDAVYTLRNLREDVLPWRTADDDASLETMRELRAFAAAHPDVPLVPTHDAEAWARLGQP